MDNQSLDVPFPYNSTPHPILTCSPAVVVGGATDAGASTLAGGDAEAAGAAAASLAARAAASFSMYDCYRGTVVVVDARGEWVGGASFSRGQGQIKGSQSMTSRRSPLTLIQTYSYLLACRSSWQRDGFRHLIVSCG